MDSAALDAALASNDDDAIDVALDGYADDPVALVDAVSAVLEAVLQRGPHQANETRWQFRLAAALEASASQPSTPRVLAARHALRAAQLQRDTLNDGEGTTRTLVLALMLSADDEAALREAIDVAGGPEPALTLLDKAVKRSKGDDDRVGRLRRSLARIYELVLKDKERAFFEALKAGRKLPNEGAFTDDVYRLGVETGRLDEVAAFFLGLAEDEHLAARVRATAFNKLGTTREEQGDLEGALVAFTKSLHLHETRAARRKAERLQDQLEVATPLPPPVAASPAEPRTTTAAPSTAPPAAVTGSIAPSATSSKTVVTASPTAETDERSGRERRKAKAKRSRRGHAVVDEAERTTPTVKAPPSPEPPTLSEPPRIGASAYEASDALVPVPFDDELTNFRQEVVSRAQEFLRRSEGAADVAELVACADALAAISPTEPRVLLLLRRALLASTHQGSLAEQGVALLRRDAGRHGVNAVALITEIHAALPAARRHAYAELWLTGAQAAGHDVDVSYKLLAHSAAVDAPEGPSFSWLDALLGELGDVDRRDAVLLEATQLADAAGEGPRRLRLRKRRIALLEHARRDVAAAQAWMQLAFDDDAGRDDRTRARRFLETKTTAQERARFLEQLADRLTDDEAVDVLRELFAMRLAVDDRDGGEAAARALLRRRPGDVPALDFLTETLAQEPGRADELIALLRTDADRAIAGADVDRACAALERLARVQRVRDPGAAAAALVEAVRLSPGDHDLVERACEALLQLDCVLEVVGLLDQLADDAPLGVAARLWARAAEFARYRLKRPELARQLLDKSVAADDTVVAALVAHADLASEQGDASAALASMRRAVTLESDPRMRAATELKIGLLLEGQLHRDDEAIRHYRAAVAADTGLRPAFEALAALARRVGESAFVVDALTGLAALQSGADRAATLVKLARVFDHDRGDPVAAMTAYENAAAAWPADLDALQGLVALKVRALHGGGEVDAAVATPAPELVDELAPHLDTAEQAGAALPFALRRLLALAWTQRGQIDDARDRFEALLQERPDDLATLLAFSRHLLRVAHQPLSPGAAAADDRRREVLESVLQHHAYALKPDVHVDIWGDICALRLQHGDRVGAKKAAKKALALIAGANASWGLEDVVSDRAVRAFVLSLEDSIASTRAETAPPEPSDLQQLDQALRLDLGRALAPSERARLKEKQARLALVANSDVDAARALLQEAVGLDPDASSARECLFDLELSGEDPRQALERSRALVATEPDPRRRAQLHLRLFRLHRKLAGRMGALDDAAAEVSRAIELDPTNAEIVSAAEQFFRERKDARSLDALWTTQLKSLDRNDVVGRTIVLDRLAQLRRYELKDLPGAIEACEAWSALDPTALKPREDAARLWSGALRLDEAQAAWRSVLERDVLVVEAWRGLCGLLAKGRQGDEAFAVAATMVGLGLADDETARAVRVVRPPFPRWPVPSGDLSVLVRRLGHPAERIAIRAILELVAPRLLSRLGRPYEDFSVRPADAIVESRLPPSVVAAIRAASTLAGVGSTNMGNRRGSALPLFVSPRLGDDDVNAPQFAALPTIEPALMIHPDVVRGGMTPERAFALGRAMAWLSPWAVLAASLDDAGLRRLLEGLVAGFLSSRNLERPSVELEASGAELRRVLIEKLSSTDVAALEQALVPALRDWTIVRGRIQIVDWKAAISLTGDRLGFLLSGDLTAAVKVIRSAGAPTAATRQSLRELVLFSISAPYFQLRRDLSLTVPEHSLAPILDLG
jgi:tetratricopeptide (TPR) repeat protein